MNLSNLTPSEALQKLYPFTMHEVDAAMVIGEAHQISTRNKFIVRSDGQEMACVGKSYTLIQPSELLNSLEPLHEQGARLTKGYVTRGGARLSIEMEIPKTDRKLAKVGDIVSCRMNSSTSFDGSLPHMGDWKTLILRCLNGACGLGDSISFKFKHTKNVHAKLANANQVIAEAVKAFNKTCDVYDALAVKPMTHRQQVNYVHSVFTPATFNPATDTLSPQLETKINRVIELLDTQRGIESVPAMRGTAWQAYNAVTEYLTHESGRSDDARLDSNLFGTNLVTNRRALQLVVAM